MNVIFYLIPIAIVLIAVAIAIFFWAVKSDQFDDLERQGSSILFDEDEQTAQDYSIRVSNPRKLLPERVLTNLIMPIPSMPCFVPYSISFTQPNLRQTRTSGLTSSGTPSGLKLRLSHVLWIMIF